MGNDLRIYRASNLVLFSWLLYVLPVQLPDGSAVDRSLVLRVVVESIPPVASTELFLIPANTPELVQQISWRVLSYLWDGAYKGSRLSTRKE